MPDAILLERARALPGLERLAGLAGVFLVGGAVRDLLLGREPADLDLAVDGDPAPAAARLAGERVAHDRFGTVTVRAGGLVYDLARTRAERYPRPGALPQVRPAPIDEDLERRDFTVNALALELASGALRAAPGAQEDLAAGRLRILHPGSFIDDPTRLLRLARYAARLGFAIEPGTRARAQAAVAQGALATVSGPRLGAELRLAAREPSAIEVFGVLSELGIDEAIEPRFGLRDPELAARALRLLPADGRRDILVLALACARVDERETLARRLGLPGADVRAITLALAPAGLAGRSPGEVAERLRSPEQAALAGALEAEAEARRWLEETRHVGLVVTGDDLRAAGVPAGPELGAALRALLRAKRDGEVTGGRESELAAALRILGR